MREPFSFGAPERRRFAMQFGYDMRPRFWQEVRSNLHLVIAALGTAALLGVAAVALWLALPANEQAVASPEQTVPSFPVKTTKIVPAAASTVAAVQQAAGKTDAVSPAVVAAEAEIPALAPNDPRWTGSGPKTASGQMAGKAEQAADKPSTAAAFADPAAATNAAALLAKVAAPSKTATDDAQTAAIATPKPQLPAATQGDGSQAKAKKVSAAGTGRILRAVTMRTGPKKSAADMGTIPAKTSVQVMSCKQWCQIVYNGKRGWVYKSFIKTGT